MANPNQDRGFEMRDQAPTNPFRDEEESVEPSANLSQFNPATLPHFDLAQADPFANGDAAFSQIQSPPPAYTSGVRQSMAFLPAAAYSAGDRQSMAFVPASRSSDPVSELRSSEGAQSVRASDPVSEPHSSEGAPSVRQSNRTFVHHPSESSQGSHSSSSSITLPQIEFPRSVRFSEQQPTAIPPTNPHYSLEEVDLGPAFNITNDTESAPAEREGSTASFRTMSTNDTLYDDSDDSHYDDDDDDNDDDDDDDDSSDEAHSEGPGTPIEDIRASFGDFQLPPVGRESMVRPRERNSRISWLAADRGSQRISMHGEGVTGSSESLPESIQDDKFEAPSRIPRTGTTWIDKINPLKKSTVPAHPEERAISREYGAPWYSQLTFQWIAPLMAVGYERRLDMNDIWRVNPDRGSELLTGKTQTAFKSNIERGYKHPLFWALFSVLKRDVITGGLCQFLANIFTVMSPYTLRYLIEFAAESYIAKAYGKSGPSIAVGLGYVFGITAMQILQSMGTNHFLYNGMMVGGQTRGILAAAIFEKSIKLSGRARAGGKALPPPGTSTEMTNEVSSAKGKKAGKGGAGKAGVAGDGTGWGNGKVLNLMSVDAARIDNACGMIHMIWTAPVCCIITLCLLCVNLGPSALAGFTLVFIGTPLLTKAIGTLFVRRKRINKINDQRVGLTHEIFSAIKFVKLFGWEQAFMDKITAVRKTETRGIQVFLGLRNIITAISITLPVFATLVSIVTYSLSGHTLAAAQVFSSVALFNSLRMPLNLLPSVIGSAIDSWASLIRIEDFLMAEEVENTDSFVPSSQSAVQVKHADFTWERNVTADGQGKKGKAGMPKDQGKPEKKPSKNLLKDKFSSRSNLKENAGKIQKLKVDSTPVRVVDGVAVRARPDRSSKRMSKRTSKRMSKRMSLLAEKRPFQLHDINFSCKRKELIAVVGGVGSGKSSLLGALAGDMRRTEGHITWGASRAFCAQNAWIQNTSVKNNILFGNEMKPDWYNQVIEACALRHDLEMLPEGDETEIGERGITFSGGQKQRLNIARAIYHNSDVVLLDDPLSAVDAHVGRHIFDNAICGLLRNKCRILATHQLQILNRCDRVIMMDKGRITAIDTFGNLMANNKVFASMMASTSQEEQEEKEEEADVVADQIERKKTNKDKPPPGAGALKKKGTTLMQAEERGQSSVPFSLYVSYVRASGSILNAPIVLMCLILAQGGNLCTSLWLSWWIDNKFGYKRGTYIATYGTLGVSQAIFMYLFATGLSMLGTRSSKSMLQRGTERVLRAPMSFFDTTPLGRITNRFSKDVDIMDYKLSDAIRLYATTLAMITSIFILVIVYFHYFAIAVAILFPLFLFAASYYRASAREIKRYESNLRSTNFARFSEALTGTACIRAYGVEDRFCKGFKASLDEMNSAYYLTFANQRWLSVRLDCIGNIMVLTVGLLVALSKFNVSPSVSGLVLSYILGIVQMFQYIVRQLADVENSMNSVERLDYYAREIEQEAPLKLDPVEPSWPECGEITFSNVEMRYRAGLPLVLKGLTMHVKGGERIGVVGRTGAGKSSIMTTLFRLVEISGGRISIDGHDISRVGLHDLRTRLGIIPQDPNLFRGTIRSNLDPFNERTDLELWTALRQADMAPPDADVANKRPGHVHLDDRVEEDGSNFSLGQRQLLALARALVRNSRIIVCDEATSSVDLETDLKIQKTMKEQFIGKTLLVIAHRLRTIIDYDRICVMDQGRIAEFDSPKNLFLRRGIFKEMCDSNGITFNELRQKA